MIDRGHARNPVSERVADNDRGPASVMPDHLCHVAREIVQRQTLHRACTASTAGLRPQHVETGAGNRSSKIVKIQGIATARGQENDRRPAAFGNHFDAYIVIGDNLPDTLCLRRRRAQRNQTGRNARQDHTTQNDIPKSTDRLHVHKLAQPQRLGMPAQVKGLCSDQIAQRRRKIGDGIGLVQISPAFRKIVVSKF